MNDVEKYLRERGEFGTVRVPTDWLRRAVQGLGANPSGWAIHYFSAWLDAHPDRTNAEGTRLESGAWCEDDRNRNWWVTDTPEFDRAWFRAQGVRPPKRITDFTRTYWKDYGGGLSKLSIR